MHNSNYTLLFFFFDQVLVFSTAAVNPKARLTAEYVMRSRAPARSRRHEGASSTRLHSPPIPRSHCHPNISTKLHFQEFWSLSLHNGLFPGSCPARRCPARQGGSFLFSFPSCVRSLAKRQLQPSLITQFAALRELRRSAMKRSTAWEPWTISPTAVQDWYIWLIDNLVLTIAFFWIIAFQVPRSEQPGASDQRP